MNKKYDLRESSVQMVIAICEMTKAKNLRGSRWHNFATSIADFVRKMHFLSEKQANWVCCSADHHKMARPSELKGVKARGPFREPIRVMGCPAKAPG